MFISIVCYSSLSSTEPAVHFYVSRSSPLQDYWESVNYTDVHLNLGNGYQESTGHFVVPVRGVYQFYVDFQSCRGNSNNVMYILVNKAKQKLCHCQVPSDATVMSSCSLITQLNAGDQVSVMYEKGCAWSDSQAHAISFSGSLLQKL